MADLTQVLVKSKETKNKVVYSSTGPDAENAIDALYLSKSSLPEKAPKKIRISIDFGKK